MNNLLLTSCVHPAVGVAVSSPRRRLAELLAALDAWSKVPEVGQIVIYDTSGFRPAPWKAGRILRGKRAAWLASDLSAVAARWGKGRSEAIAISRALAESPFLADGFWKITGRLFVHNFADVAKIGGSAIACAGCSMGMDTRCFYSTGPAFREFLEPGTTEIDDRQRATFIEAVYWRHSVGVRAALPAEPRYTGASGTSGRRLHRYYTAREIGRATALADELLGPPAPGAITVGADLVWRRGAVRSGAALTGEPPAGRPPLAVGQATA